MANKFEIGNDMISRLFLLLSMTIACVSCTSTGYGVYTLQHRYRIDGGFEAVVFRSNGDARFEVWKGGFPDGIPVCQMQFDSDGEISSWVTPYIVTEGNLPDGVGVMSDGTHMVVTRWITDGSNTIFLVGKGNDGIPEKRFVITPTERRSESITPVFTIERMTDVEKESGHVRN